MTAVDGAGDESVPSAAVSPALVSSGGGGGGGGCFIGTSKPTSGANGVYFAVVLACFAILLIGSGFRVRGSRLKK